MNELTETAYETTPDFSLEGQTLLAKAVDVYDGDTASFAFQYGDMMYKIRTRLSGLDSPEIRPRLSSATRDEEKKAAIFSRNRLIQILSDVGDTVNLCTPYSKKDIRRMLGQSRRLVWLKVGKSGKFGRPLVKIFLTEEDLGDSSKSVKYILLKEELCCPYFGGRKCVDFRTYFRISSNGC